MEISGHFKGLRTVSGANAEEGEIVALSVGEEVAAGVGDAVDLVKGVGQIGDARHGHGNNLLLAMHAGDELFR
jgi:hypothetical protein